MNTLKTILYMGSTHGFFTFYIPFQLASQTSWFDFGSARYLAFLFWIAGSEIIIQCSMDIIRRGHGTPAFVDPPKQLVNAGLYRYVRNPIYLGALIMQIGYIVRFGSMWAIFYALFMFSGFHFLIIAIEEPILRNTFGAAYEEYCRRVPRWIPRLR